MHYPATRLSGETRGGCYRVGPMYRSPMADFGYDAADYPDVDPIFRTTQDFDRLLTHVRGEVLPMA
jgi:hypothetical protein